MAVRIFSATRLLRAAVLLPVVLFTVAALPSSILRCRYTGLQVADCCCPKGDANAAPVLPALREDDCCDRETLAVAHPPVERQPSNHALDLIAFAGAKTLLDPEHFPSARVRAPPGASGAPIAGPPLLLVKRAWLI